MKVLARSKLGKAFQYALNHEKGLRVFLDDGEVPLTNSLNERSINPFTVSRKTGSLMDHQEEQEQVQQHFH